MSEWSFGREYHHGIGNPNRYDQVEAENGKTEASRVAHSRFDVLPDPLICVDCGAEEEPGEEFMHWNFKWNEPVCPSCHDLRAADYEEWEASQASGIEVRSEYREEVYEEAFAMYEDGE